MRFFPHFEVLKLIEPYKRFFLRSWLKYSEIIPKSELAKYQAWRLRFIAEKALDLSFYKEIFKNQGITPGNLKSLEDLKKLPVVFRKDFRARFEKDYINLDLENKRGYWVRTSGSSGEPFRILRDNKYQNQVETFNLECYRWFDININSRKVNIISAGRPSASNWGDMANSKNISIEDFQNKPEKHIEFLKQWKPVVLEANPSYLLFFAHSLIERKGLFNIPYIVSYGEQLYDKERELLKKTFFAEVINRYGLTEITNVGVECPAHDGFHVNALACLVEIVNENGVPINDEGEGEIVITSLINEITPLIRYSTGDRGHWILEICSCGRTLPRFRLIGRRDDHVLLRNNRIIYIASFRDIFYKYIEKIQQFQIIQKSQDEILVSIVPNKDFNDDHESKMLFDLRNMVGNNINVIIRKTANIPWPTNGKFKALIRSW